MKSPSVGLCYPIAPFGEPRTLKHLASQSADVGFALCVLLAATALRWAADGALGAHLPYVTYFIAVAVIGWRASTPAAVGGMVAGWLIADYFFVPPRGAFIFRSDDPKYIIGTLAYFAVAGVSVIVLHAMRRAQRQTAEAGERLRTTLASIGDAVITADLDARVTMMNGVAERLTGWTIAEAAGKPLTEVFRIINQDTRRTVENPCIRALREGTIVGLANHTLLIAKDGTERPIDDAASPIRCARGELVGCVLIFRDITERYQAEQQLRETDAILRAVNAASPSLIYVKDRESRIRYANPATCEVIGKRLEEVLGKDHTEYMGDAVEGAQIRANDLRIIESGQTQTFEERVSTPAGERMFLSTKSPHRDANGQVVGLIGVSLDVTDRLRAEEALRQSERRFTLIANSIPQLAWMANADGWIFWYNQRWYDYTGTTLEFMQGWGWESVHDPNELPHVIESWKCSHVTGEPWEDTFPLRGKDGNYRWFLSRAEPLKDEGGKLLFWFGTNTDITEHRQTQQALLRAKEEAEAANIAKENFLASLSHELRTPLTPVLATLGIWEREDAFPQAMREELAVVRRNVDLEARLIDDMLDLTRIAKGKISLHLEALDVHKLLNSLVSMYASEINAKRIDLTLQRRADECFVRGDAGRLQQVFWNVLKNAVKFTPERGRIDIQTRDGLQGHLQVVITDTGVGMRPDTVLRLFRPFEQETVGRYGGLGLGLAISKALLEAQEGSIEARSDGPGKGASFIITLPCTPAPQVALPGQGFDPSTPVPPPRLDAAPTDQALEHRRRVLLVEDHVDTARVMSRLIADDGHDVTTAHSLAEALEALERSRFDLLLSDVGLPDGTGVDLIREVRQQHGLTIPAVALTGFGMEDDVARTREAGFDEHLTKPIDFANLQQTIQRLCKIQTPPEPPV